MPANTSQDLYSNAPATLRTRYDIYEQAASDLGWYVKTFEEWLKS